MTTAFHEKHLSRILRTPLAQLPWLDGISPAGLDGDPPSHLRPSSSPGHNYAVFRANHPTKTSTQHSILCCLQLQVVINSLLDTIQVRANV